jgi:hypothetical protein
MIIKRQECIVEEGLGLVNGNTVGWAFGEKVVLFSLCGYNG